jgi:hypothetical protein
MSRLIAFVLVITVGVTTTPIAAASTGPREIRLAEITNVKSARAWEGLRAHGDRPEESSADLLRTYVTKLPIGSVVKVTPKEGKSLKGILMLVDHDAIVVKPKTRIARPERRIPFAEIDFVELQERNGGTAMKAVGIGLATGVAVFLSLLLVAVALED